MTTNELLLPPQTAANLRWLIHRQAQALVIQLLAECLGEFDCVLAECLRITPPQAREVRLAPRHLPLRERINTAIERDRQETVRRRADARHRMPRAEILSEPVVRPIVVENDTLKVHR